MKIYLHLTNIATKNPERLSAFGMEKAVDFCFRKGRSSGERHSNQTRLPPRKVSIP